MRITKDSEVRECAENLNRRLEARGSASRVCVSRRYDYMALDETDVQGRELRTLAAGTRTEIYYAVWNMIRGIDLIQSA